MMIRLMQALSIILVLGWYVCALPANVEALSKEETRQFLSLKSLQWSNELSEDEKVEVTEALESSRNTVAKMALRVAVVHDLSKVLVKKEDRIGPEHGYTRVFGRFVASVLKNGENPYERLKKISLEDVSRDAFEECR